MADETVTIEYTPVSGPWRRVRFVPRADGDGWWRITEENQGCHWRETGREPVRDVIAFDTAEVLE